MKQFGIWSVLVIFGLVAMVPVAAHAAPGDESVTVIGVLEKQKQKTFLNTGDERFMVVGQDFSLLIGKRVKATGKVIENYRGKSMVVTVMEIVRN